MFHQISCTPARTGEASAARASMDFIPEGMGAGGGFLGVGGKSSAGKPALCLDGPGIYAGRSQAGKWAIA